MGRIAAPSRLLLGALGCHGLASLEKVVVVHKTSRLEWEGRRRASPELANKVNSLHGSKIMYCVCVCVCLMWAGTVLCSVIRTSTSSAAISEQSRLSTVTAQT